MEYLWARWDHTAAINIQITPRPRAADVLHVSNSILQRGGTEDPAAALPLMTSIYQSVQRAVFAAAAFRLVDQLGKAKRWRLLITEIASNSRADFHY